MNTTPIRTLQVEAEKLYEQEFLPLPSGINLVRTTFGGQVPCFDFPPHMRDLVDDYLKATSLQVANPTYVSGMLNHFRGRWRLALEYIDGGGKLQRAIEENLGTIPERERTVLIHRFGLYGEEPRTLKETSQYVIGKTSGKPVRPSYVGQVQVRAFKMLRHPTRTKPMRSYFREQWISMMGELKSKDELSPYDAKLLYEELAQLQRELSLHESLRGQPISPKDYSLRKIEDTALPVDKKGALLEAGISFVGDLRNKPYKELYDVLGIMWPDQLYNLFRLAEAPLDSFEFMGLSNRVANMLNRKKITTIIQLLQMSDEELLERGITQATLQEIKSKVAEYRESSGRIKSIFG